MNKQQVIKRIGKSNWSKFARFINGQTARIKDGEIDYYECDVDNFIAKMEGRPIITD